MTGYGETAAAATAAHPDVDCVAFTGSTEVGRLIRRAVPRNLKKLSLEFGGKAPNIVFADANLEKAIEGVATAVFCNTGEDCGRRVVQAVGIDLHARPRDGVAFLERDRGRNRVCQPADRGCRSRRPFRWDQGLWVRPAPAGSRGLEFCTDPVTFYEDLA